MLFCKECNALAFCAGRNWRTSRIDTFASNVAVVVKECRKPETENGTYLKAHSDKLRLMRAAAVEGYGVEK